MVMYNIDRMGEGGLKIVSFGNIIRIILSANLKNVVKAN